MMDSALYHRLTPVTRRIQMRKLFLLLAMIWTLATMFGIAMWWMKSQGMFYSPLGLPILCVATFAFSLLGVWFALRTSDDDEFGRTVTDIEQRYPELDSSLVTAIEQHPVVSHGNLGFLQQEVVRKAVYHGYQHSWSKVVPQWQLLFLPLLAAAGLLAFMISIIGQFMTASPISSTIVADDNGEWIPSPIFGGFRVEPGDVEVERFSSLMVLARFGNEKLPSTAELVFWNASQEESKQPMVKSLDDPVFGTRINSVNEPLEYAVRFDGQQSPRFSVSVFEFPRLNRADAKLRFPDYTGLEDKVAQDVRRVSAVMGTQVTWMLTLNKEIRSGRLLGKDGQEFELVKDPVEPFRYIVDMTLKASTRFQLHLIDAQDRKNKSPVSLSVQVLGNQPPEIRQLAPASDVEVSPVEELTLAATFWDDFGIERAGVSWSMVGKDSEEMELATSIAAKERRETNHILSFEELEANPNELMTFYFWAEDKASNGEVRRTLGDIHMVTVRSFESIFRQGQQPGGGGGGGGQQGGQPGMDPVDLQPEIVYAIWNLSRREIFDSVTDSFVDDVTVVSESQKTAIAQLDEQAEQIQDSAIKAIVDEVRQYQVNSVSHLDDARESQNARPLSKALESAQLAYQAMLHLKSLESEVRQSQQQSGGGGGGGNRQRQQMQQLELENDENRYESEQTASEREESTEDRENRQVLSRLRELARRQNDLNKRIKELQSALEEAETREKRQEVEEQLKRLREEQQQILRDTEELQDRMERPENQSTMSEQAEQLEQARENARRSSDALEQGDTTRAAAEGTRALRDMEELRDEFQNRSSGRFDEQMQNMRNEAREIEKEQQKIAEELEQLNEPSDQQPRSLSDAKPENDVGQRLDQQRERVEAIREEMRKTIEESEEYEPILAERLYDTYRETQQNSPEEALDSTAQSLRQGFVDDAVREQRRAAKNIEQLREGIDEAAESVLGDETEALRRANRELQRLSNALENEFDRANPDAQGDESSADPGQSTQESSDGESTTDKDEGEQESGRGDSDQNDEKGRGSGGDDETEGDPAEGKPSDADSANPGQPAAEGQGQGDRQDPNRQPGSRADRPSLVERNQDPQGARGAGPEINYDQETWNDPITGDDFVKWSDRMRDVEEMVADPELRAEAARIRENARSIRRDIKRHSRTPNWDLVRLKVIEPMFELQDRVHEELLRRGGEKSLVPVDRDPVPAEFEDAVQNYFEQLGRGQ